MPRCRCRRSVTEEDSEGDRRARRRPNLRNLARGGVQPAQPSTVALAEPDRSAGARKIPYGAERSVGVSIRRKISDDGSNTPNACVNPVREPHSPHSVHHDIARERVRPWDPLGLDCARHRQERRAVSAPGQERGKQDRSGTRARRTPHDRSGRSRFPPMVARGARMRNGGWKKNSPVVTTLPVRWSVERFLNGDSTVARPRVMTSPQASSATRRTQSFLASLRRCPYAVPP